MADLSKIKLNGTEYDLKDAVAREAIANIPEDKIFPVNITLISMTKGTSDKTHSEIATAVNAGKIPFVYINYLDIKMIAPLTRVESNYSVFTYEDQTVPDHLNYACLKIQNSTATITWKDQYTTFDDLSDYLRINNYITSNDAYTKTEINGLISSVLHYKGTKATVDALPSNDNVTGDVWHVTADGSEWAWDGTNWQELGTAVDLSAYRTAAAQDVIDDAQDSAISGKYTKPSGGIPYNDMSAEVKNCLDSAGIFYATYYVTTAAEIEAAYQTGKKIICVYEGYYLPLTYRSSDSTDLYYVFEGVISFYADSPEVVRVVFSNNYNSWTIKNISLNGYATHSDVMTAIEDSVFKPLVLLTTDGGSLVLNMAMGNQAPNEFINHGTQTLSHLLRVYVTGMHLEFYLSRAMLDGGTQDVFADFRIKALQGNISTNTITSLTLSTTMEGKLYWAVLTPISETTMTGTLHSIEIPTKTSDLTNDSGFITGYTETDPTVPAWAKAATKPTYTAAEVGALPDTTVIPAAQVQSDWNATSGMGVILNKPNLSTFMVKGSDYVTAGKKTGTTLGNKATAEGGYTTASGNNSHAEGGYTTASGTSSHAEGYYTTASGTSSHAEGYYTTASGNNSHAEGQYTTAQSRSQHVFGEYNILDTTGTPTTRGQYVEIVGNGTSSARSNTRTLDWSGNEVLAGKLTIGTAPTADMDVTTKQYVDNAITTAIGNINQFEIAIVADLPTTNIDTHTIYFKSNLSSGNNIYDEYMYINSSWELIGSTQVDLSNYLQSSDIASWAKQSTKPTYTAAEVGALPSTYTAPVISVNGQTGAVTLSIPAAQVQSDWNATTGMGVILNKPTIPAATTVTNTLSSGTLIATINGTNIYAPSYTNGDEVSY